MMEKLRKFWMKDDERCWFLEVCPIFWDKFGDVWTILFIADFSDILFAGFDQ